MEEKRMKLFTVFISISVIVTAFSTFMGDVGTKAELNSQQDVNNDWPIFQHDPQHTGHSNSIVPLTNNTRWINTKPSEDGYFRIASPVTVDNSVFVETFRYGPEEWWPPTVHYRLYALDFSTGEELWRYDKFTRGYKSYLSPALVENKVIIGVYNQVIALNQSTGDEIWNFTLPIRDYDQGRDLYKYFTSPIIIENKVLVGCNFGELEGSIGKIFALRVTDGKEIWNFTFKENIVSPTAGYDKLFTGTISGQIFALNLSSGKEIWNRTATGGIQSPLTISDNLIFIGSIDSNIYALNLTTGSEVWKFETSDRVYSSPAIANDLLFAGSNDTRLYALRKLTGEELWNFTAGNPILSSPAIGYGKVVFTSGNNLFVLDGINGKEIWNYNFGNFSEFYAIKSSPAIANGTIIVGSNVGKLYAFGASSEQLRFKWENMIIGVAIGIVAILAVTATARSKRKYRRREKSE